MIFRHLLLIIFILSNNFLFAQQNEYDKVESDRNKKLYEEFMERRRKAILSFEGFPPVPFQAPDMDGKDHFLSDHKGQVLILQFWQIYCEPCRSQIVSINKILEDYEDQSVAAIGFVNEYGEDLELHIKNTPIDYPVIPNSREIGRQAYGGDLGFPRVFIIDKFGTIRKVILGGNSYDELSFYDEVKSLIEELRNE